MTINKVVKMGTPSLFQKSQPVSKFNTPALHKLIQDLTETMHHYGGVGIAAPQIGCNLRIIIFGFEQSLRYPDQEPIPETVLINPRMTKLTTDTEGGWEGCLSVPGLRAWISRSTSIRYSGHTPEGHKIEQIAHGFHARIIQHEIDHINGVLFPQRIKDYSQFGFEDALKEAGKY